MTEHKAQKIAIRERMARTGEPYSVARRAVLSGEPHSGELHPGELHPGGPVAAWPNWIPKPWNEEIPEGKPWDEQIPEGKPWGEELPEDSLSADQPWLEQYFADGAATEGISVHEFKARLASRSGPPCADEVPWPHDPGDEAAQADREAEKAEREAQRAQDKADRAQVRADLERERADRAQEVADQAQEWLHAGGHPGHQRPVPRVAHPMPGPGRGGRPPWWYPGRTQTRRVMPAARPSAPPPPGRPLPPPPPPAPPLPGPSH